MPTPWSITDGIVTIRPPEDGDRERLVTGRDDVFHRFLGKGSDDPAPTGCIVVADEVVGWVDFDSDREWLGEGEVNLGYNVFAPARASGYGTRAVKLLLHHLALTGAATVATLLIDPENARSLALAERAGFVRHGDLDGNPYWKLVVPPLVYSDGSVTIRRRDPADLDVDLEAKDHDRFGAGPKWSFTVDSADAAGVGYIDCDLDNGDVPSGEANISYASHPAHRGRGHVSRAVRLVTQFLRDHTGARTADIITDAENEASLRVARAVGASSVEEWVEAAGRTMIRHRLALRQ